MSEHPQDFPDPNYDSPSMHEVSHPRRNGCSCPWHPFQLIAWFFILLFSVAHYGFLAFYVPGLWRIAIYVIPGLVLLVHATANIVTTAIDPAEPAVKRKLRSGWRLRPVFNRSVHKHVIEDRHCSLCQVDVTSGAKHCRLCDKCVMDFDHHCKWLNNCIGAKNYRWFITTISSALLGAVMLLLYNTALFILYFAGRNNLRYNCNFPSNSSACNETLRIFGAAMPDAVFPTLTAILGILALIAVVLVGHLTTFHLYLISKGLSTYDYIVLHRESEEDNTKNERDLESGFHGRCAFLRRKLNRVTPQSIPMDSEQSIESRDAGSIGSNNSAGMANFGRTPPLSTGSEECMDDNRTDEQKLEVQTTWAYVTKETQSNSNLAVASSTMKNPGSIAQQPKTIESEEVISSPLPATDAEITKRLSNPDELLSCYEEEGAVQKEALTKDLQDGGTLAVANAEEGLFESTMDSLNAVGRTGNTLAASTSGEKEEVDWGTVNSQVMIQDSSSMTAQSLEDRHTQLRAQTEQQILSDSGSISTSPIPLSPSRTSLDPSLPSIKSHSLLANENLTTQPASDFTPPKYFSVETLQQSTHTDSDLQEIPLNMLQFSFKDLPEVAESPATDADRSVSPITKKVSFQDLEKEFGAEADAMYSPGSGRPLPSPPLPPIGSSRPLPPLGYGYRDVLGSHDSLVSGSSQLLSRSGSVTSLPVPDPRYRRGTLPRLSWSSNLSLDAHPSGGKAKRKGRKRKVAGDQPLPECREVCPPSSSPKD